jgi:hypothetical protein
MLLAPALLLGLLKYIKLNSRALFAVPPRSRLMPLLQVLPPLLMRALLCDDLPPTRPLGMMLLALALLGWLRSLIRSSIDRLAVATLLPMVPWLPATPLLSAINEAVSSASFLQWVSMTRTLLYPRRRRFMTLIRRQFPPSRT